MLEVKDNTPWMDQAACNGQDTEQFFPDRRRTNRQELRIRTRLCRTCPVVEECLEFALTTKTVTGNDREVEWIQGIWGNTDDSQRERIRLLRGIE